MFYKLLANAFILVAIYSAFMSRLYRKSSQSQKPERENSRLTQEQRRKWLMFASYCAITSSVLLLTSGVYFILRHGATP